MGNYVFTTQTLIDAVGADRPGVLDADRPEAGKDELGLEGEHHALLEEQVVGRQHRQLVELEAHAVTDEAHL